MKENIVLKLEESGLMLPDPPMPGGSYASVNIRANVAYVAIQFPINNGRFLYQGRLGETVSREEGYKAAELCALNILSHIDYYVGFDRIVGLNHLDIYYQQAQDWDEAPKVADGASTLFLKVLESKGQHSRAIVGVQNLPRNFCVGITSSFTIEP